ncbi:MAG TPA: helix-turn-helix domain-containing protein [Gemmataceae bacterium]|nr:helix-turn-helix domain-containing protein [Gemmataceae bacterium]
MATKTINQATPDTYFDLVKKFPLIRIRDDDHLGEALKVIDRLLATNLDDGERAYLDVLTDEVELYEEENVHIPAASEADVLRELMQANNLSQARLAKSVGVAQSTLSAVLTGTRALTKEQVINLAKFFNVSPAVFLQS